MKVFIKRILYPNNIVKFFIFNIGFGLLIYVFFNHLEETPLAYVSYALSSYALVIFCIWFYKVCKFGNEKVKNSSIYQLYKKNNLILTKFFMYISLIFNLIYGVFKLLFGIYYKSIWFITIAVYYLLLCFIKLSLVRKIDNFRDEYKKMMHTGIILLFFNLILLGIIVLIIKQDQIVSYDGYLIYLVALYDFYLIISAFVNVIKHRKNHNPIVISSKCINLTVAMISMISLEVAMIYQFGNNDSDFKLIMTATMGFGICIINSIMAIYMIVKSNRFLKE